MVIYIPCNFFVVVVEIHKEIIVLKFIQRNVKIKSSHNTKFLKVFFNGLGHSRNKKKVCLV